MLRSWCGLFQWSFPEGEDKPIPADCSLTVLVYRGALGSDWDARCSANAKRQLSLFSSYSLPLSLCTSGSSPAPFPQRCADGSVYLHLSSVPDIQLLIGVIKKN